MISLNNLFKRKQKLFDFEQPGGTLDWTPLHVASYTGSFEVIQELIKKAKVDVFARAANLKTPRMVARNSVVAKVFRIAERTKFEKHIKKQLKREKKKKRDSD